MRTRQEQIDEMAGDMDYGCTKRDLYPDDAKEIAKALYLLGYRKLQEDSVVLSREEYIDLSRNYVKEQKEQAVKEFAEKLKNYFEDMLVDEFGNTTIDIDEFKGYIDDLLKEY